MVVWIADHLNYWLVLVYYSKACSIWRAVVCIPTVVLQFKKIAKLLSQLLKYFFSFLFSFFWESISQIMPNLDCNFKKCFSRLPLSLSLSLSLLHHFLSFYEHLNLGEFHLKSQVYFQKIKGIQVTNNICQEVITSFENWKFLFWPRPNKNVIFCVLKGECLFQSILHFAAAAEGNQQNERN